ncbi:MAG TPA: sterol desaturase family protein [Rhodospirillales bacterium]|nr:sterol desaturase family protein [Rhodospirillales bacterium]
MDAFLIAHEGGIRLGYFVAVLALMLAWERAAPRRHDRPPRLRQITNIALVAIDAALLRLLLPAAAVAASVLAQQHGLGLFNAVDLPAAVAFALTMVLLDLAVWAQHVAMHKVPLLWRLHRVHHSDVAFDVTTGVRFHPAEILLSMLYKVAVVVLLGAPAAAVIAFEVMLSVSSLITHGNVRLPAAIDRRIRRLLVTPDMHRVHHSIHREETDSNYGFTLSLWDQLFGTLRAQPRDGHAGMRIGLAAFRGADEQRLDRLLLQPLRLPRAAIAAPPSPVQPDARDPATTRSNKAESR